MTDMPVTVLVVDDDAIDIAAIRRSFAALHITNPLVEATNGVEALEHLRGDNNRPKLARPNIVLVDLNMPRMSGIELLDELRADPQLCTTVVFVLTTSDAEEDRWQCYERHIAGYMLKHQPGKHFHESIALLEHYFRVNEFPPEQRGPTFVDGRR